MCVCVCDIHLEPHPSPAIIIAGRAFSTDRGLPRLGLSGNSIQLKKAHNNRMSCTTLSTKTRGQIRAGNTRSALQSAFYDMNNKDIHFSSLSTCPCKERAEISIVKLLILLTEVKATILKSVPKAS